jgi:hypothetical protein
MQDLQLFNNFYIRREISLFNNQIAIIFDLANKGQHINWCFKMLTHYYWLN